MSNIYAMYYYADQALLDGKELTHIDRIIKPFSLLTHMQLWFSVRYDHKSCTSTMQGEPNGVKIIDTAYSHPLRWVAQLIPMTDTEENAAWAWFVLHDGNPYDLKGAAATATGMHIIKPSDAGYWCNEACMSAIKFAKGWGDDCKPDTQLPIHTFFDLYRRLGKE